MLDIEPVCSGEGELTSSYRLLDRVCKNYPKAFEVVVGDGLYLNSNIFKLLASHHKYAAAVLKDETRELYDEAISLCKITEPIVYEKDNITYKVWDNTIEETSKSTKIPESMVTKIPDPYIKKLLIFTLIFPYILCLIAWIINVNNNRIMNNSINYLKMPI